MSSAEIKQKKTPKNTMKQFSTLPSCFLTPESDEKPHSFGRVTPTQDQSSSVFLSPPPSLERKSLPNFGISTHEDPLKLELHFDDYPTRISSDLRSLRSPLLHGGKIGRTRIDLITELVQRNCFKICRSICEYLNDRELSRFASVSKSWRSFVKEEPQIRDRLSFYLLQRKEYCILKGKENLGSPTSVKPDLSSQRIKRTPLVNIDANKVTISVAKTSRETQLPILQQQISTPVTSPSENFRPCPKCCSPSNYARVLGSHCCCQRCGLEFCSVCLQDTKTHKEKVCRGLDNPCERIETRSKTRRKGTENLVGSRKSKERMRRL
ncbi:F-box only protein 43-like [Actinia tenebrosa]|uniref:F-box only protein 43-like n=1 Tax=Actinia tenebrosa TaxID=6105 RepID=A0A6P8H292_ACTTE|nr:F-box only protein 43-like [Actinia tenebrosa]